jgi:MFS transporter, MHS family, shikimate and dehydroshikimate transport protein
MSSTPAVSAPPSPQRVALASAVGATIEWYDFFLYGTAAGLVFDKLFFNGLDGPAAQFAAFGTFAVGFLARPVGGFVFGHFGDRIGRKKMLLLTLLIMGVGTAAIGLLPSYDSIGVWAPVLLVTLRVLQGIGVGGEYGGAVLLAVEYAPARRRGFYGSFAHIGVPGGLLLASGAFSIASLLPDDAFLAWGWRACFLVSVVLLAIGAYIRLSVMETPAFAKVQERKEVSRVPLRDLLAAQPKRLLLGMGTRYIEGFTFNFFSVYLLAYVVTNLGLPKSLALTGVMVGAALGVVLVPLAGALSDRVGRKPVFRVGAWLALLVAFPVAALVQSGHHVAVFAAFVIGLGLLYGTVYGPLAAFWSELFDTRYRYTALSTLYQMSGVVASGFTPLIAAWLVSRDGGHLWWVAAYNVAIAVVSLVSARLLPETRGRDLEEPIAGEPTRALRGEAVPVG